MELTFKRVNSQALQNKLQRLQADLATKVDLFSKLKCKLEAEEKENLLVDSRVVFRSAKLLKKSLIKLSK